MKILSKIPLFILTFLITYVEVDAQQIPVVELEAYKRIDEPARDEVSGIIKSRAFENVFWVHGDSGTSNRIYAINSKGEVVSSDKNYKGTRIKDSKNKDWEDISYGKDGTLLVADLGNNCHCREDMKLYVIAEPNPDEQRIEILEEYLITYPERSGLLSFFIDHNQNAEAIFVKDEVIYIITKNQASNAYLFKLDSPVSKEINVLEEVDRFNFQGLVTAADISEDESKLVVLTYNGVWLFELEDDKGLLEGNSSRIKLRGAEQVESITFDDDHLIIAEENGDLYRISLSEFEIGD